MDKVQRQNCKVVLGSGMKAAGSRQPRQAVVHPLIDRLDQRGERENHAVIQPPEHIIHLRAVPDAHQQKHQNVAQRGGQGAGDVRTGLFLERLAHAGNRAGQREGIEFIIGSLAQEL